MKNKFLNICLGITMVLLGTGFLVRSVNTANAAPKPEAFMDEGTNKIGKYMFQVYYSPAGVRSAIVWDTETGKSMGYYYDGSDWYQEKGSFPAKPVGE